MFLLNHPTYICTAEDLEYNKTLATKYIKEIIESDPDTWWFHMSHARVYVIWNPYAYSYSLSEKEIMISTIKQIFSKFTDFTNFKTITEIEQNPKSKPTISRIDGWLTDIDEADYIIILDHNWVIDLLMCYAEHNDKPIFMMTCKDI